MLRQLSAFLLCACLPAQVETAPDPAQLVQDIRSGEPERVESAVDRAHLAGAAAVPALVGVLAPAAADADPARRDMEVRAATRALWRVARHATAPDEDQRVAQESRREVAKALLDALDQRAELSAGSKRELLHMVGETANDRQSLLRLAAWLDRADHARAALFGLQRAAHPAAAQALVERLQHPGALSVRDFVDALGERRATAAVEPILAIAEGEDRELAQRARSALARIGDARAASVLASALQRDPPGAADDWLRFAAAQRPEGATRAALLTGYGLLLQRDEPHLRQAGMLGLIAIEADGLTRTLLALLEDDDTQVRLAARASLTNRGENGIDETLQSALATADVEVRPEILRVLTARGAPTAKDAVLAVAKDAHAPDRAVALELLGTFPDPDLEGLLLSAAGVDDPNQRQAAAASLWRHARAAETAGERERALRLLHTILDSAEDDALRRDAIAGIGRLADSQSLPHLEPFAQDGRYKNQVAAARARIALAMAAEFPDEAVQLMLAAYRLSGNRGQRREAARYLLEMGFDTGALVAQSGFLQDWHVLGPWPAADAETLATHPFDRAGPDPSQPVELGDATIPWQKVHTDDPDGVVDLRILRPNNNVSAFALATLDWPDDQAMRLKLGSDDAVAVWVNGDLVHENFVMRGVIPDQDECEIRLRKGANWILLRVHQGGGDWGFTVRLCDAGGQPVDFSAR